MMEVLPMRTRTLSLAAAPLAALAAMFLLAACSTEPSTTSARTQLNTDANATLDNFKQTDPSLDAFLRNCYGYAIFPSVGKGGAGIGGAYGHGVVYQGGNQVGYADLTQATIGLQLGGESYGEIVVFQNKNSFDQFTQGNLSFSADASAVAINSGAAATTNYSNGVAVFVKTNGGLMAEAAIGGQKFNYAPL
jgi:lipid-binding SYLF domain-containing protein